MQNLSSLKIDREFILLVLGRNDFDFNDLIIPDIKDGPSLTSILHPEDGTEIFEVSYFWGYCKSR